MPFCIPQNREITFHSFSHRNCICVKAISPLCLKALLTKAKLTLVVETSVQQSGLEDFFLGLTELQFLDNFRKANGLQVPPRNVQRCWRPHVGFHSITYHFNQCHILHTHKKNPEEAEMNYDIISNFPKKGKIIIILILSALFGLLNSQDIL